jgi:hypothetical protein
MRVGMFFTNLAEGVGIAFDAIAPTRCAPA